MDGHLRRELTLRNLDLRLLSKFALSFYNRADSWYLKGGVGAFVEGTPAAGGIWRFAPVAVGVIAGPGGVNALRFRIQTTAIG